MHRAGQCRTCPVFFRGCRDLHRHRGEGTCFSVKVRSPSKNQRSYDRSQWGAGWGQCACSCQLGVTGQDVHVLSVNSANSCVTMALSSLDSFHTISAKSRSMIGFSLCIALETNKLNVPVHEQEFSPFTFLFVSPSELCAPLLPRSY